MNEDQKIIEKYKLKVNTLEIENVKRVKAVRIDCTGNALTVIGGRNGQGKTSVLDAIAFALGGGRYAPSTIKRDDSVADPSIKLTLNNGMIVERSGKNATLKVTDPDGGKGGQQLLNEFISQLAIDLPKFLNASNAEKAKILLSILGIGAELEKLEIEENKYYNERHTVGQIADRKKKHAEELPCFDGVPADMIKASELIIEQQGILAKNGENQRKRARLSEIERELNAARKGVETLRDQLIRAEANEKRLSSDFDEASKSSEQLQDESTAEIEKKIEDIETINAKIRANLDKSKAEDDAKEHAKEYDDLSDKVDSVRTKRIALLDGAALPLDGLSVSDGELVLDGKKWDCMSGSDQLRVGTAIARKINPKCGFVLLDKLEQMDQDTLDEFGVWLENEGLQAIATRVSTGPECSIIIEDGKVANQVSTDSKPKFVTDSKPKFVTGEF